VFVEVEVMGEGVIGEEAEAGGAGVGGAGAGESTFFFEKPSPAACRG